MAKPASKLEKSAREASRRMSGELSALAQRIDFAAVAKAASMILAAEKKGGRLHLVGIGKPAGICRLVASSLSSTGTAAYFLDAAEAVHGGAGQVKRGDVVIAVSNSGETLEVKSAVTLVQAVGAQVIGVSGRAGSWLSRASDLHLEAGVKQEGDPLNLAPRASVLAELFVLNVLSVTLQTARGLTAAEFRRWHPAGSLGKRNSVFSGSHANTGPHLRGLGLRHFDAGS